WRSMDARKPRFCHSPLLADREYGVTNRSGSLLVFTPWHARSRCTGRINSIDALPLHLSALRDCSSSEREPMAKASNDLMRTKTVGGKDLEGKTHRVVKTLPQQMQLFQTFLPDEDERYSNTIELYDAIPKYFTNPRAMEGMRQDGKYLPELERSFRHRNETYRVTIYPARVKDQAGQVKEYYPGPREELVEESLRKYACGHMDRVSPGDKAGVQITLY